MRLKRFSVANELYLRLVLLSPRNDDYQLRLAWSGIELGRTEQALRRLRRHAAGPDRYIRQLQQLAQLSSDQNALFTALLVYDRLMTLTPEQSLRRQRIRIIDRIGAVNLADGLAKAEPSALDADDMNSLTGDVIAGRIAWGKLPGLEHDEPFYETDGAIAMLRRQLAQFESDHSGFSQAALRSRFDLIEALHDRGDMDGIIDQHRLLLAHEIDIPTYALEDIADAYEVKQQPDTARQLYERILEEEDDKFDIRMALFYVYLDLEDYDRALVQIDALADSERPWSCTADHVCYRNNRKLDADITAAMARAYAERPDLAEQRLTPLLAAAPYNFSLRTASAQVSYYRGRPREALRELDLSLAIEPQQFDAAAARFDVLMSLMDYGAAAHSLADMKQQFAVNRRLANVDQRWQRHNLNELNIDASRGRSSGSQEGSRDLSLETYLYSRPLQTHYRPFLHSYYTSSRFPEGNADYHRIGVGIEYRKRDLALRGELHHNNDAGGGVALDGNWLPRDHWSFGAHYDSNDENVPLRGRFNENISGKSAAIDASYVHSEATRVDATLQELTFSDDNRRKTTAVSLTQRLVARPHYSLNGNLGYYASTNTRVGAPYYNPLRDSSTELALTNEWLQYRFYSTAFRHRLVASIGRYSEKGYASHDIWSLLYEQQWNLYETLEFAYGLGRAQRVYDGVTEYNDHLQFRLNWRF